MAKVHSKMPALQLGQPSYIQKEGCKAVMAARLHGADTWLTGHVMLGHGTVLLRMLFVPPKMVLSCMAVCCFIHFNVRCCLDRMVVQ